MSARTGTKTKSSAGRSRQRPAAPRRIGRYNFLIQGLSGNVLRDLFHHFMTVSWPRLFVTLAAFFLGFDLLFGLLYHQTNATTGTAQRHVCGRGDGRRKISPADAKSAISKATRSARPATSLWSAAHAPH